MLTNLALVLLMQAQAPQPGWSIGAGISATVFRVGATGQSFNLTGRDVPTASLGVERRLLSRTWLLLGFSGGVVEDRTSPENTAPIPPAVTTTRKISEQQAQIALGVRQSLLSDTAPVDVSVIGIVAFGYQRTVDDLTTTRLDPLGNAVVTTTSAVTNRGTFGAGAGLSVERRLIEFLALRFTLGLLQASYSAGRNAVLTGSATPTSVSGFTVGLAIEPGLELRGYF